MAAHAATLECPCPSRLLRELQICWSFTRGDLTATVLPATTFALAAWMSAATPRSALPTVIIWCLSYFWLYIYTFDLSNQLIGIEEDRLNKPHRPLVVGLITPREAWWRLGVTTTAFLTLGAALGVLEWTALWVAAWVFHNHLGGARAAWGKNAAMVAGTIAQLAAAWQIVTPLTAAAWTWILTIAIPLGVLVSLQDLRDIDGDLAIGRRTAVAVVGETACRWFFAAAFTGYPVALYLLLYRHAPTIAMLLGGAGALLSLTIAYRVVRLRSRRADHTTYLLYTLWYCVTLASAVFALR
ncbi:UbiA family prenyltransferase [Nocardia sp. NBC_00565]|uniref:UbiA family prenyltransferase n=1 Tax=Nocardia sp. NBC_00565 TaxID=2975993 RepID=UPI002E81524D|nr:UbiA family prenyltransferase [Nocardia sp. NBC_00565]WUC07030.1 UbiA family prenyltransferase [Nocardia sp. NBC_00565]